LSALAHTGCRAGTGTASDATPAAGRSKRSADQAASERSARHDDGNSENSDGEEVVPAGNRCKKHLVLVLGGVPHSKLLITSINRMYARLAKNLQDAPGTAEVVVVDPSSWQLEGQNGITKHHKMWLEDFAEEYPVQSYLDLYDQVAIVDELQFGTMEERDAVRKSGAYRQLVAYADKNKGRVAWWEFVKSPMASGGSRGSDPSTSGMRELNNNGTLSIEVARTLVMLKGPLRHLRFGEKEAPENLLNQLLLLAKTPMRLALPGAPSQATTGVDIHNKKRKAGASAAGSSAADANGEM